MLHFKFGTKLGQAMRFGHEDYWRYCTLYPRATQVEEKDPEGRPTSRRFLLSERFPTTLHHFLQVVFGRGGQLHVSTVGILLVAIVQGLRIMHMDNFAHCGLREDSIFLTEGLYPILAEFQSTLFCTNEQAEGGKLALQDDGYTPPELLGKGTLPSDLDLKKVDSYSVGVILVHMLAGSKDYPRVMPN